MPALTLAHPRSAFRPLRAFSVSLRSAGQSFGFTAIARSSGDALVNALALPGLQPPVAASVKPLGSSADALRVFRAKCCLADLVECVGE
jgi:hypothetical protein